MRVELLYWDGCPSHPKALADLREAMRAEGLDQSSIEVRRIETDAQAQLERFPGSPTIRVDGADVAPTPGEPFALTCRVYHRRDGRISPTPDPADLRDVLRSTPADTRGANR